MGFQIRHILLLLLLSGCSASWHLERACDKEPTICIPEQTIIKDTVVIEKEAILDTFVLKTIDTITIEKERLRIDIRRSHDTIEVDAECRTDTIYRDIVVEQPKPVVITKGVSVWYKYSWIVVIILLILSVFKRLMKGFI